VSCNHRASDHAPRRVGVVQVLCCGVLVALTCTAHAQSTAAAADRPTLLFNVGLRLWSAQWDSWNVGPTATGVAVGDDRYEVVESLRGGQKLASIPVLSVRYGPAFLSASAMTTTKYRLHEAATPAGFDVQASRRERDVNLGYVFASGISVSVANKEISQRFGPDEYKWRGPLLGLGVSAPIGSGWGTYSSIGVGQLKGKFPAAFPDAGGRTRFDADYAVIEAGFTYVIPATLPFAKALVVTAGYRAQRMGTKNYTLGVVTSDGVRRPNTTGELVDTTQGFVLGAQGTF
jgi:opacity protein-like surface antigen